jgi:hypothetical protein
LNVPPAKQGGILLDIDIHWGSTMFSIKHAISVAALLVVTQTSALADDKCYEETSVPTSITCDANNSNSADFVSGCKSNAATTIKTEIACPTKWVNTDGRASHAAVCSGAGLTATSIGGAICAAGERRPASGEGAGSIYYRYGTWGTQRIGGSIAEMRTRRSSTYYYCWNPGNKRDYDSTDIIVAYACKP